MGAHALAPAPMQQEPGHAAGARSPPAHSMNNPSAHSINNRRACLLLWAMNEFHHVEALLCNCLKDLGSFASLYKRSMPLNLR